MNGDMQRSPFQCLTEEDRMTFAKNQQRDVPVEEYDEDENENERDQEPAFTLPPPRFNQDKDNKQFYEAQKTLNFEITFDPKLLEVASKRDIQRPGEMSGCRTNPLPTCKNADRRKRGGFAFEGFRPQRKKFQMTIAVDDDNETGPLKVDLGCNMREERGLDYQVNIQYIMVCLSIRGD